MSASTLEARQAEAVAVKKDSGGTKGALPSPGDGSPHREGTGHLVITALDCGSL